MEEKLLPGASVSRVARRHDVNANQVFYWRKLYREGQLRGGTATHALPVKVANIRTAGSVKEDDFLRGSGTMAMIQFNSLTLFSESSLLCSWDF